MPDGAIDAELAAAVHERLLERGETVCCVESLTGGLLAAELTMTPGASTTFRGGLVTYATDLKASLAGVDASQLAEDGPVSESTAAAMARGGRQRMSATWGLSTTGVAGPDPQDGVSVGTVYVAVAGPDGVDVRRLHLDGDRNTIRRSCVVEAVSLLARTIGL